MSKRLVVSLVAVMAAGIISTRLRAQDEKWNNVPPRRSAYEGKKSSGPAPRRDLSGIWDAAQTLESVVPANTRHCFQADAAPKGGERTRRGSPSRCHTRRQGSRRSRTTNLRVPACDKWTQC